MKPIRIGLIGPGGIADHKLIPALASVPGAVLWSVTGRDLNRASAFAEKHNALGPIPIFDRVGAMLRDPDLDAVIIATPDRMHAEQIVEVASAGKHVFVEKPMTTSLQENDSVRAAISETGVRFAVGYHHRFHAGHRLVREMLQQKKLGDTRRFRATWHYPSADGDWRNKPETGRWWSLAAVGTHVIDLAWWLLEPTCGPIVSTRRFVTAEKFGGNDERAQVTLRFASGATADIDVCVTKEAKRVFDIVGSDATITADWTLGGHGGGKLFLGSEPIAFETVNPYVAELAEFVAAIRENRAPSVGLEAGARNVELLDHDI